MPMVVIGNIFVDIKGFPDGIYIPGGRNAGRMETVHGGVGRNVVEDIANIELRPVFVSLADDDESGDAVIRKLKRHRINTDYIVRKPNGNGKWLAIFDHTGDVVASISVRPDMSGLPELLEEKGDEIFAGCDSIVVEIDMEKEVIRQVFRFAEKYGKKVFAVVANMAIAIERRDYLKKIECFVCNIQEAGQLFLADFSDLSPEAMARELAERVKNAGFHSMVVTMGAQGSVYADREGNCGVCPAHKVQVCDTTGAGDAFCAGVAIGLTYGKTLPQAAEIGTRLSASVITQMENVCPRFQPRELGLDIDVED